ncbi:ATP-binding protein, partial [Aureimonas sp. AU12]|uniref:ATP-binding protein n=1 Tax=Aureimonas sp. AU12 TaxID=1638161 RepID=UPI001FCDC56C
MFLNEGGCRVFSDFVADAQRIDELSAQGLASRLGLLLSGPPGTGKTLLAGHVAAQLSRPLYVVRLDSVISSLLGDTAKNIRSVFDFVPARNAVLFLDEMDAVAKLRDDRHELGELKRVVNT